MASTLLCGFPCPPVADAAALSAAAMFADDDSNGMKAIKKSYTNLPDWDDILLSGGLCLNDLPDDDEECEVHLLYEEADSLDDERFHYHYVGMGIVSNKGGICLGKVGTNKGKEEANCFELTRHNIRAAQHRMLMLNCAARKFSSSMNAFQVAFYKFGDGGAAAAKEGRSQQWRHEFFAEMAQQLEDGEVEQDDVDFAEDARIEVFMQHFYGWV